MTDEREGLLSASSGYIVFSCAGALNAQRGLESIPTPEAQEGEEIHDALETDDFTNLSEDGRSIAERLSAMTETAFNQWWTSIGGPLDTETFREKRLWIHDSDLNPIASAKLDYYTIAPKETPIYGLVLDYKTGYLRVTSAKANIQLRIQALALFNEYPSLQKITVGSAQYRFTGQLDTVEYTVETLKRAQQELRFNLWRANSPDAPRSPGDHCRYCRAKGTTHCPESVAYSLLPMAMAGTSLRTKDDAIKAVSAMTVEDLAFVRSRKTIIEHILSAINSRLRGLSEEELAAVGLRLVGSGSTTKVTDLTGARFALGELVTDAEFQSCCSVSLGALNDLLVARVKGMMGMNEKDAKKHILGLLRDYLTSTPKQPSLRPVKGGSDDD